MKLIPMPATVIIHAINWWRSKNKMQPKTLEDMLRVKDLYVERASLLN